jgi:hypothetical protein
MFQNDLLGRVRVLLKKLVSVMAPVTGTAKFWQTPTAPWTKVKFTPVLGPLQPLALV